MWSLYLIINKFLKAEDQNVGASDGDHSSLVESFPFGQSLTTGDSHNASLPCSHLVEVPHIRQLRSWDCGLACVLMVLRTFGIEHCDIHTLGELCCTTSIWTVDLAYLLQKFSVSFSFFTITLGANPNFSVETFYKEELPKDLVRVDRLFRKALEAGINIQCRSISGEEISVRILSGRYIAIALVDQYKLKQIISQHRNSMINVYCQNLIICSRSWLEDVIVSGCYGNSGYSGHYIVVCGYDAERDEFEIRDPASSRKCEKVSLECLEEARKSFGTDEDLILISLEKNEGVNKPLA